jgi:hypothetical protein
VRPCRTVGKNQPSSSGHQSLGGGDEETRDGAVYSWCHDPARTAISGRCHGVIVSERHEAVKLFDIETRAKIMTSGFRCSVTVLFTLAYYAAFSVVTDVSGEAIGRNLQGKVVMYLPTFRDRLLFATYRVKYACSYRRFGTS